jgi:hypothetical protein
VGSRRGTLKKTLSQDPPLSLSEASRAVGTRPNRLRIKFPELTAAIALRFKTHTQIQKEARKTQLRQEVWEAIVSLEVERIYPSIEQVTARVKVSRTKMEIYLMLREIRQEMANNLIDSSKVKES